jgi:2-polyprenyl-6-methoxyphenol hydroxylase-like FAD-dependent oxidoreductase
MDVAIFGAGIAGLVSAIAIRRAGHKVRIFERSRESRDAGMGFILVPEVRQQLEKLGIEASGVPLNQYHCRNEAGQVLYSEKILAGTGSVLRRDFVGALASALDAEAEIHFDEELTGFDFAAQGSVTAGRTGGGHTIQAGLYIAADGTRSRARRAMFPEWPADGASVQEIVGLARCPQTIRWAAGDFNKFHASQGGVAFGVLQVDTDHVVWYVQFDTEQHNAPDGAGERREFVESLVGKWAEPIPHLLATADFEQVHVWRPVDADLVPSFHRKNLVLVGDAAHPLSPFTSQGVSSAVADAATLGEALGRVRRGEATLEQALEDYSRERRQSCAPYIEKGRELRRKFLTPLIQHAEILPIAYTR